MKSPVRYLILAQLIAGVITLTTAQQDPTPDFARLSIPVKVTQLNSLQATYILDEKLEILIDPTGPGTTFPGKTR